MPIRGFLEQVTKNVIEGWAIDDENPTAPVKVTIKCGKEIVAEVETQHHRTDLGTLGYVENVAGFRYALATPLAEFRLNQVDVYAVSDRTPLLLPRTKRITPAFRNLRSQPEDPTSDITQFPVFILGPARSGTSALALGLLKSGKYIGRGEGHLLPLFHNLICTTRDYAEHFANADRETHFGQVGEAAFLNFLRRAAVNAARDLYPKPHWLDKTPTVEMVKAAPLYKELWPNAKFLFLKRGVLENIRSRVIKFPDQPISTYYRDWAAVDMAWLNVRKSLEDSFLEIDHREMVASPNSVATAVSQFLELNLDESLILADFLSNERPEATSHGAEQEISLSDLPISYLEKQSILNACQIPMKALGFDLR